ncbi:MAG TPA: ComF family protein [Vicinamibacterales bacterium]|nr:ComF family protein [Vicinamibacterales bacterium]
MIRPLCDAILAVTLAPCCACCAGPLERPLDGAACDTCWAAIPRASAPLCRVCGDSLRSWRPGADPLCARCTRRPRLISIGRAIGPYEGSLRDILHALKYDGRRSLARPLAGRMQAAGRDVLDGADCVVPVPLHFRRLYSRGFNQSAELAAHLGLPVVHALRRTRATVTQTDLPEAQRHENVLGAFAVRRRARVGGAVVVIVDDVSTTGATLDACARVLLDAGAKEVRALTAARAAARLP